MPEKKRYKPIPKKYRSGKPKKLLILQKSKVIQRWLLRNPWIRPLSVFNLAATIIQKNIRRFITRIRILKYGHPKQSYLTTRAAAATGDGNKKKLVTKLRSQSKVSGGQLNKYLAYMDEMNSTGTNHQQPPWLKGGFSSWCAVKLQASWRRYLTYRRYTTLPKRLVNQVAAIIIQSAYKNSSAYIKKFHRPTLKPTSPRLKTAPLSLNLPLKLVPTVQKAAYIIQSKWHAYCNQRIYRYFRDLILEKLQNATPQMILTSFLPNESAYCDLAAKIHIRFRLGGRIFPPRILYKIFTHAPLCDINTFAPRDYTRELYGGKAFNQPSLNPEYIHHHDAVLAAKQQLQLNKQRSSKQQSPLLKMQSQSMRVGRKYFDALVITSNPQGMKYWYRRDEHAVNEWRPIAAHLLPTPSSSMNKQYNKRRGGHYGARRHYHGGGVNSSSGSVYSVNSSNQGSQATHSHYNNNNNHHNSYSQSQSVDTLKLPPLTHHDRQVRKQEKSKQQQKKNILWRTKLYLGAYEAANNNQQQQQQAREEDDLQRDEEEGEEEDDELLEEEPAGLCLPDHLLAGRPPQQQQYQQQPDYATGIKFPPPAAPSPMQSANQTNYLFNRYDDSKLSSAAAPPSSNGHGHTAVENEEDGRMQFSRPQQQPQIQSLPPRKQPVGREEDVEVPMKQKYFDLNYHSNNLLAWSNALDFEAYSKEWSSLGCAIPVTTFNQQQLQQQQQQQLR